MYFANVRLEVDMIPRLFFLRHIEGVHWDWPLPMRMSEKQKESESVYFGASDSGSLSLSHLRQYCQSRVYRSRLELPSLHHGDQATRARARL